MRRLLIPALAVSLLAGGCGGEDGTSENTAGSAASDWANSVCEAVTNWNGAMASARTSLTENPSKEGLESAADDVESATQTLADDLKALGKPDTASGEEAKAAVDELATNLEENLQSIQDAVAGTSGASEALSAVSTVSATLVTMGDQISETVQKLRQVDADGELRAAFDETGSCADVTTTEP
jgi:methyl-accepting chemotaxis protein